MFSKILFDTKIGLTGAFNKIVNKSRVAPAAIYWSLCGCHTNIS